MKSKYQLIIIFCFASIASVENGHTSGQSAGQSYEREFKNCDASYLEGLRKEVDYINKNFPESPPNLRSNSIWKAFNVATVFLENCNDNLNSIYSKVLKAATDNESFWITNMLNVNNIDLLKNDFLFKEIFSRVRPSYLKKASVNDLISICLAFSADFSHPLGAKLFLLEIGLEKKNLIEIKGDTLTNLNKVSQVCNAIKDDSFIDNLSVKYRDFVRGYSKNPEYIEDRAKQFKALVDNFQTLIKKRKELRNWLKEGRMSE